MAIDWSKWIYTQTATPHLDAYKQTESSERARAEADIANINSQEKDALKQSNAGYDNTANQNWVNYMQAQKRLPSQLNSMGIRGGASESSLLRLGTNYGSNVAANEAARNKAAEDIRKAYAQQVFDRNRELEQTLSAAAQTARENQLKWENEQKEKDLQYFSGAIEGLYKSRKGYKKLIEQLRKSKDPNKDVKIMLATRAMNMLGGGGGGGGGGGRRGYGGGYGGYGGYGGNGGYDDVEVNNSNPSASAVKAAQKRGKALTDYYKKQGSKASSYKNKKTTNVSGKQKKYNWGYNIKGTSSKKYYP
jgi:hypothetical protein